MPKSVAVRKHALTCLRIAVECRVLAAHLPFADLKHHFLRIADVWEGIAEKPLQGPAKPTLH